MADLWRINSGLASRYCQRDYTITIAVDFMDEDQ
jgi:hypothetical protein